MDHFINCVPNDKYNKCCLGGTKLWFIFFPLKKMDSERKYILIDLKCMENYSTWMKCCQRSRYVYDYCALQMKLLWYDWNEWNGEYQSLLEWLPREILEDMEPLFLHARLLDYYTGGLGKLPLLNAPGMIITNEVYFATAEDLQ